MYCKCIRVQKTIITLPLPFFNYYSYNKLKEWFKVYVKYRYYSQVQRKC